MEWRQSIPDRVGATRLATPWLTENAFSRKRDGCRIATGTARRAVSYTAKARFLAGEGVRFRDQPRPLRRVYFLGDGRAETVTFERLRPVEALVEWVKHSFLLDIEERPRLASHFDQVARLADLPIHYRLDYPRRYEALARVRAAILEHAREESTTV